MTQMPADLLEHARVARGFMPEDEGLLLHRVALWGVYRDADLPGTTPRLQLAGALSLGLWLATIVAGRMLGYLD